MILNLSGQIWFYQIMWVLINSVEVILSWNIQNTF